MADLSIQQAFLDGINDVFSIMFAENIKFKLMDEGLTDLNIYKEAVEKFYDNFNVYELVAKVTTTFAEGELPIEDVQVDAVFTVPTKQLIQHSLPRTTMEDLKTLAKGKLEYKGITYLIHRVVPKTLVADEWQMYDFICYIDKKVVGDYGNVL